MGSSLAQFAACRPISLPGRGPPTTAGRPCRSQRLTRAPRRSTPARARETASAGAGETPASGHAAARIPGWQPRSTLNRRQDRLQRDSARDAVDHNREPRCRRIGRCGRDSRQFGYLLISHSASLSGLMVRHAVGSAPSACRFDEILDSLQSERRGIVVSRWS